MSDDPMDPLRRTFLAAAGLAVPAAALAAGAGTPPGPAPKPPDARGTGKPGEFEFLSGTWTIANRRRKAPGSEEWDEFPGEATCWSVLAGAGSIEELRIPARGFSGLGIRLLDRERSLWTDFWVPGRTGVLSPPPLTGAFEGGVGTFTAAEEEGGKPLLVRGVWDRVTPTSCRWHQATSRDGGKSWVHDWFMEWKRA